jgi:hypothetical protein
MSNHTSRRQALAGFGAGALGTTIARAAPAAADAAAPTVRGTWVITPKTSRGPAPFRALAAFAAGGVFVTTGSDEGGTGLGEWSQRGATGFAFTYLNFHFDPSGKPANTVKVRAAGTFHGSKLSGHATLSTLDPSGARIGSDARFTFTGRRLAIEAP